MEKKRAVHKLEDNTYLNTKFSWLLRWSLPQDPGFLSSLVALGPEISHISVIKQKQTQKESMNMQGWEKCSQNYSYLT